MIQASLEERARVITMFLLYLGVGIGAAVYALSPLFKWVKRKISKPKPPPLPSLL